MILATLWQRKQAVNTALTYNHLLSCFNFCFLFLQKVAYLHIYQLWSNTSFGISSRPLLMFTDEHSILVPSKATNHGKIACPWCVNHCWVFFRTFSTVQLAVFLYVIVFSVFGWILFLQCDSVYLILQYFSSKCCTCCQLVKD